MANILFVERSDEVKKKIKTDLDKIDIFRYSDARDLNEAKELYDKAPNLFDLILIDDNVTLELTEILNFGEYIRGINSYQPILVISSLEDYNILNKFLSIGIDDYIEKPVNSNKLIFKVRSLINKLKLFKQNSRNEDKLKSIIKNIPDTIFKLNTSGLIKDMYNESNYMGAGLNKSIRDILPSEEISREIVQLINDCTRDDKNKVYNYNHYNIEKDILEHKVVTISKLTTAEVLFFIRDETENKSTENKWKDIFNLMPDNLFLINSTGTFTEVKQGKYKLFRPRIEIIGKTLLEVFPEDIAIEIKTMSNRILHGDTSNNKIILDMNIGGESCVRELRFFKVSSHEVLMISRDVTESFKMQEEIRKSNAHLSELQQITSKVLTLNNVTEITDFTLRSLSRIFNNFTNIYFLQFENKSYVLKTGYGCNDTPVDIVNFSLINNIIAEVAESKSPRFANKKLSDNVERMVIVPVVINNFVIGQIIVTKDSNGVFKEEDIKRVADFTNMLSIAIEKNFMLENTRRQLEKNTKQEKKTTSILEALPDLMFIFDRQGKIIEYKQFGLSNKKILTDNPEEFINNFIPEIFNNKTKKQIIEGIEKLANFDADIYRFDSKIIFAKMKMPTTVYEFRIVRFNGYGEYLALVRDVTETKKTEWELIKEKKRYRAIVEYQQDMIARYDKKGVITYANEPYAKFFTKQPAEKIIGKLAKDVSPLINSEYLIDVVYKKLTKENPLYNCEVETEDIEGNKRWIQWSNLAIFDCNGNFIDYQAVGRDITELKEMRQKISSMNEQLKQADELEDLSNKIGNISDEIERTIRIIRDV